MAEMHSLMDSAGHEEAKNELFGAKESSEKEASLLQNLRRWPGCLSRAALTQLLPLFMFLGLFLFLATILVQVSRLHPPPRGSIEDQQCNRNLANFSQQIQLNMKGIHQLLAQINASLASLCHPCPLGWEHFKGSCYFFSRSQKNWEASSAACQDRKAQLVIINSEAEEKFLQSWDPRSEKSTWIGLGDHHREGSWRWVDGSPLQLSFWKEGEPNNQEDEDCAELQDDGWNDGLCNLAHVSICEKQAAPCPSPEL